MQINYKKIKRIKSFLHVIMKKIEFHFLVMIITHNKQRRRNNELLGVQGHFD